MPRSASLRRSFVRATIAVASAAALVSCALAGYIPDGSRSNDATATDIVATTDGPTMDRPAPTDAPGFPCTGTTCTVANGVGACVAGSCQVGSCTMGYADIDRNPMNGCECMSGAISTSCGTPTDQMTIASGGMRMVDGLLSTTMGEHWMRVSFATGGHPHIRFMTNPGMAYRFDVVSGCGTGAQVMCPDRTEGATGLTEWEYFDAPSDAGVGDGGPMPEMRMNPWPATLYVKVKTTMNSTACMRYTLVFSN
jgi:hypothetical protein